jgi:hypothetical protein
MNIVGTETAHAVSIGRPKIILHLGLQVCTYVLFWQGVLCHAEECSAQQSELMIGMPCRIL